MELYLLKFSVCLLVFWLSYVLLLEKQKMHHFKRFYLLGSFAIALIIPQLTIVQNFEITNAFIPIEAEVISQSIETAPILILETILWSIYVLGVALFIIRFAVNLFRLYRQITTNNKQRYHGFIYVLLKRYHIPHSFFKYIFVNQQQFENNQIPEEVRLHEETHAKQWHSLDILLLELLQIVFWFHPLVYILKHHVKLNHEFLADDAVLQQGVTTKSYQNILLQFSSNTHNHQLVSAINYSSFKKRFTVMKTQTSKTRIWISTLLLLPITAILFYSFAEREYVEQKIETKALDIIENELDQQKATKKQISEYNAWAKKMNIAIKEAEANGKKSYPIIKKESYKKYYHIYTNLMSEAQRKNAEAWPNIPPPPPPTPETPKVKKGDEKIPPPPPPPPAPEPPKAKKNTEDTPPPPPEPKKPESTLDFIIKMAKANASFYYEGKAITSDEAIALLKKNNQLNVNAYPKSKEGKPIVYISKEPIEIDKKKKSKN